jgi:putative PIN family toxin of toxin-antitoxin system
MNAKIVVDTNALISALSRKSMFHRLISLILNEQIILCVTDEIMLEYEEKLKEKYSLTVANNFLAALNELPNVLFTKVYYHWNLLKDQDDNKFIDCYVAANATLLITNDRGFNVVNAIEFPPVNIMTLERFIESIPS